MPEKFTLREIDLTGDGHGRHIAGTPDVYSHGWHLLKALPGRAPSEPKAGQSKIPLKDLRTSRMSHEIKIATRLKSRPLTKHEIRKAAKEKLTLDERKSLVQSAGLHWNPKYSHIADPVELEHMWHSADDPATKKELADELMVRQTTYNTSLSTISEAIRLADREEKRKWMSKFDETLGKSKVGAALLKIRDRLVQDHVWDKAEATKDHFKEWGVDSVKHLATSTLVHSLIGFTVSGAAATLASGHVSGALQSILDTPFAEAGMAAAVSLALGAGVKALRVLHRRHRAKKAEKVEHLRLAEEDAANGV